MSNENFCFICYEFKMNKERKPKELIKQKLYIKTCECNGLIHNECLETWFKISGKCPICREFMLSKNKLVALIVSQPANTVAVAVQPVNHGIRMRIYCYIQRKWNKIATYINIIFLLYMALAFCNSVYSKSTHTDMV